MKGKKTSSNTKDHSKKEPSPLEELLFNISIHSPRPTFKQGDFDNEPSLLKTLERAQGYIWQTKENITSTDEEIDTIIQTVKEASKQKSPTLAIPKEALATIEKLLKDSKRNNNYLSLALRFIETFLVAVHEYRINKDRTSFFNALGVAQKEKTLKRQNPEKLFFDYVYLVTRQKQLEPLETNGPLEPSAAIDAIYKSDNLTSAGSTSKQIQLYVAALKERIEAEGKIPDSFKELFLKEMGVPFDKAVGEDVDSFKKFIKSLKIPGNSPWPYKEKE